MTTDGHYDLHLHSRKSFDSLTSPRGIIRAALARGLRGIAITDHGTTQGALEVRRLAPPGLLVITGTEVHTKVGDIVGLGIQSDIDGDDPLTVIGQIHAQGGVAFFPHPLKSHPKVIPECVLEAVDGYEALNGRAGWFDPAASEHGTRWSVLMSKAVLGNSDAHFSWEIGRASTIIPGPATEPSVLDAIRNRVTRAAGKPQESPWPFYSSQLIKMFKTRDAGMLVRAAKKLVKVSVGAA